MSPDIWVGTIFNGHGHRVPAPGSLCSCQRHARSSFLTGRTTGLMISVELVLDRLLEIFGEFRKALTTKDTKVH